MKLKYSKTNVPYITFENGNMLIFSKSTEIEKFGFKYLVFSGSIASRIKISSKKAKKEVSRKVIKYVNFIVNMNMKKPISTTTTGSIPAKVRLAGFSKTIEVCLRKIFKPLIDENGYFPRGNLLTLEKILVGMNGSKEDEWDDDPTATESFDDD